MFKKEETPTDRILRPLREAGKKARREDRKKKTFEFFVGVAVNIVIGFYLYRAVKAFNNTWWIFVFIGILVFALRGLYRLIKNEI